MRIEASARVQSSRFKKYGHSRHVGLDNLGLLIEGDLRLDRITAGGHRPRMVTKDMIRGARLIHVMGPRHAAELSRRFAESKKLGLVQEYGSGIPDERELPDPYGQSILTHPTSMRQICECVEGVVDRLDREQP